MKAFVIIIVLFLSTCTTTYAQTEFDLKASQSMLMTGKGPGQDGAINPYYGQDCYAIVENMGSKEFSVRIQKRGTIIEIIPILKNEVKKIKLLKDQELYLDSNTEAKVKARLDFKKVDD